MGAPGVKRQVIGVDFVEVIVVNFGEVIVVDFG